MAVGEYFFAFALCHVLHLLIAITPLALSNEAESSCASDATWPSDGGFDKSSDTEAFGLDSNDKNDEYIEKWVSFYDCI